MGGGEEEVGSHGRFCYVPAPLLQIERAEEGDEHVHAPGLEV